MGLPHYFLGSWLAQVSNLNYFYINKYISYTYIPSPPIYSSFLQSLLGQNDRCWLIFKNNTSLLFKNNRSCKFGLPMVNLLGLWHTVLAFGYCLNKRYTFAFHLSSLASSTARWAKTTDADWYSKRICPLHLVIPGSILSAKSSNSLQSIVFFSKILVGNILWSFDFIINNMLYWISRDNWEQSGKIVAYFLKKSSKFEMSDLSMFFNSVVNRSWPSRTCFDSRAWEHFSHLQIVIRKDFWMVSKHQKYFQIWNLTCLFLTEEKCFPFGILTCLFLTEEA